MVVSTLQPDLLRRVAHSGLAALGLRGFVLGSDGVWRYPAERPADGWHANGAFQAHLADLDDGKLVRLRVRKPRWRDPATNASTHTPPPDDLRLRFSALVVALQLFGWLDAAVGVHAFDALFRSLDDRPSRRTVQRWLRRFAARALEWQQAARTVLLRRDDKPTAPDRLFPGGVPPPPARRRGPWREPARVGQLFRALVMVLGAAVALETPASLLVSEAWWKVEQGARRNA